MENRQGEYKTLAEMSKGDCFLNNKGNLMIFNGKAKQDNGYYVYAFGYCHFGAFLYKDIGKKFQVVRKVII